MLSKIIKKLLIILSSIFIVILLFFLTHLSINYFSGNVHTVIPNIIYRSAQLKEKQLTHYSEKFHLHSMINLRGAWENNHWYQVETKFIKNHHIHYFPMRFFAYALPSKSELQLLVTLLQTAPKPLIFHCEGGADRTGLAAMISVILFQPAHTITELKHQVSWRYNVISPRSVGYQVLKNYLAWLEQHHDQSSKERFMEWLYSPEPLRSYHGWFL